jgi:hypothetical protein
MMRLVLCQHLAIRCDMGGMVTLSPEFPDVQEEQNKAKQVRQGSEPMQAKQVFILCVHSRTDSLAPSVMVHALRGR